MNIKGALLFFVLSSGGTVFATKQLRLLQNIDEMSMTFSYDGNKTLSSLQDQCDAARAAGKHVTCCSGGIHECDYTGYYTGHLTLKAVGEIAENACTGGDRSCYVFNGTAMSGSCQGSDSCHAQKGVVGLGGCVGKYACYDHTGSAAANSCTSVAACYRSIADISENSCKGPCSCFGNKAETIEAGTCNEPCECANKTAAYFNMHDMMDARPGLDFEYTCKGRGYGGRCDE